MTIPPTTCHQFVCPLASADTIRLCGGKAFHLSRMQSRGLPVLPGFVVTDRAFQQFLSDNRLSALIDQHCDRIDLTDPNSLHEVSAAIRQLIVAAPVSENLVAAMHQLWQQEVGGQPLIVRSSAVGEDSADASFAGQLDSVLNVTTAAELVDALRVCWASYWSGRSLYYQRRRGVALSGMGVLIQQQAKSVCSGVLFTVAPEELDAGDSVSTGQNSTMLIEYCRGFGAALVSGEINPGRIAVARDGTKIRRLALPEQPQDTETDRTIHANVDDATVLALMNHGWQLEQLFGGPQDVEWTVEDDGRLSLLQSRAISVAPAGSGSRSHAPESAGEQSAQRKLVLWTNANVNENFPEPISPLLYSIASEGYYHYFRNLGLAIGLGQRRVGAMEDPLRQIIGTHGAKMYYNLSSIHACLRMAPFGDQLTHLFNNFVGADRVARSGTQPDWAGLHRGWLLRFAEACRIAGCVAWRALRLSAGVTRFERTVDAFAAGTRPEDLAAKTLPQLRADLRGFLEIRFHRWQDASLADAAAMLSYGMLKRCLSTEFPDEDSAALHNALLRGLPGLVSNLPVIGLWELSRAIRQDARLLRLFETTDSDEISRTLRQDAQFAEFCERLDRYLDECGFRCSGELMLTIPNFQENPAGLIEILRGYVQLSGESPAQRLQDQAALREAATQKTLTTLRLRPLVRFLPWPTKATWASVLLKWTQRSIGLRERARMKQALLYSRCRRLVLAIGDLCVQTRLIGQSTDLFFLTFREIEEMLSDRSTASPQVAELIERRRAEHAAMSLLEPPDTFEWPEGEVFSGCEQRPLQKPRDSVSAGGEDVDGEDAMQLRGLGACSGVVSAAAAVLRDVGDSQLLSDGDILVTRQTDPGWGPLFFLIRGLVIERGGMLSHGAILAREFGIPTVVGVPGATTAIRHGQRLTVNGDRGIVQLGPGPYSTGTEIACGTTFGNEC